MNGARPALGTVFSTAVMGFLVCGTPTASHAQGNPPDNNTLAVIVIDQDGQPLGNAEAVMRGGGQEWHASTGLEGRCTFNVANGTYDLLLKHPDFYETIIRGIEVNVPADPADRVAPGPLRVLMQRKLSFEKDLSIVGPTYVPPPPVAVDFRARPAAKPNRPAQGVVTLTNNGTEPVIVPLRRDYEWSADLLLMRIYFGSEGTDLFYDEPLACLPDVDCRSLLPGESVDIELDLYSRSGYAAGQKKAAVWPSDRLLEARIGLYWMLPREDPDSRPTYTRAIERSVSIPLDEQ